MTEAGGSVYTADNPREEWRQDSNPSNHRKIIDWRSSRKSFKHFY